MMSPTKLSTIRDELRKAFKMTAAELRGWFNRQAEDLAKKPNTSETELLTLQLFRDALVKETKRPTAKRELSRSTARSTAPQRA
jgi:predicted ATPase